MNKTPLLFASQSALRCAEFIEKKWNISPQKLWRYNSAYRKKGGNVKMSHGASDLFRVPIACDFCDAGWRESDQTADF